MRVKKMSDENLIDCHKCGYTHREGYNCAAVSAKSSNSLLHDASKACVDIYMDIHVSEMSGNPEHLKKAWSVGQEIYLARKNR